MSAMNPLVNAAPGFPPIIWRRPDTFVEEAGTHEGVHLWRVSLDRGADVAWSFLSEEERARSRRFASRKLAERFIVAHGYLRRILASFCGRRPLDLRFFYNRAGKPFLAGSVRFNLSHSGNLAVIGVVRGEHDIGVDVERFRTLPDALDLARRWFSPEEQAWIAEDPDHHFMRCWVMREAFVKALGIGLQEPLEGFEVAVPGSEGFPGVTGHVEAENTLLAECLFPGDAAVAVVLHRKTRSFF